MTPAHCAACDRTLDPRLYAACQVCADRRYCLECARAHFCTRECPERGCKPGLCVKLVRDGIVAIEYGIPVTPR